MIIVWITGDDFIKKIIKILAISDLHSGEIFKEVIDLVKNNNIDFVAISGDITDFGTPGEAENILNHLAESGAELIAIPGNCDSKDICDAIDNSSAINCHNSIHDAGELVFCGFGGSNLTPFNTPFEFTEDELYNNIKELTIKFNNTINNSNNININNNSNNNNNHLHHLNDNNDNSVNDNTNNKFKVLITHAPPINTNADKIKNGAHVGSFSIRKIIEEFQPDLAICGHIHEAKSQDKIGKTLVINPGMANIGDACLINVNTNVNGNSSSNNRINVNFINFINK
ncbi:MAG: metallophosphoesterase family protein [Methanobacteriaceae archaeon]